MSETQLITGAPVPDWQPASDNFNTQIKGSHCRLVVLNHQQHCRELYECLAGNDNDNGWAYLPYGPFTSYEAFSDWLNELCDKPDPFFYAVQVNGKTLGMLSYLRITPAAGTIEIGHIHFSPAIKQSTATTEAIYLLMAQGFDMGYRRVEWKCNNLNEASKRAALRLGFVYEGTFRQAAVVKGKNRDTAWYSVIDKEWPALQQASRIWLHENNFDDAGRQKKRLEDCR